MKLTALEIKQQTFEKAFRGYDPAEVQSFLNLVASEWEHLNAKNSELKEEIDKLNEKVKHYERVESALHETLQTAKDSAELKLGGAKKESENIIQKAEMEAEAIINEATQQRLQIRQSVMRLIDRRKEIVGNIRSYLEIAQESLDQFSKDEASLFTLPSETSPESTRDKSGSKKKESTNPEKSAPGKQKSKHGESSMPPGSDKMDDILDEID